MKTSFLALIASLLFVSSPADAKITKVVYTQSPDAYSIEYEEIVKDLYLEYDEAGRLVKADSEAYAWMSLFAPDIIYSNLIEGVDEYEYEGDSDLPARVTRTDYNGVLRFTVDYLYDDEGRTLEEHYKNWNGNEIDSVYTYENKDGYDYMYVERTDGESVSNYRFRYYESNGQLKEWKFTEKVGKLNIRRDAEVIYDAHGRIQHIIRSTPNLTLESSWTFKFQYDGDTGNLSRITYTHPFEGTGYILEFEY